MNIILSSFLVLLHRRSPSDGMRPALDPIIENQPVVAVENDSDNDTLLSLKAKTLNEFKPLFWFFYTGEVHQMV